MSSKHFVKLVSLFVKNPVEVCPFLSYMKNIGGAGGYENKKEVILLAYLLINLG